MKTCIRIKPKDGSTWTVKRGGARGMTNANVGLPSHASVTMPRKKSCVAAIELAYKLYGEYFEK
jgi:hypothetical protein